MTRKKQIQRTAVYTRITDKTVAELGSAFIAAGPSARAAVVRHRAGECRIGTLYLALRFS